MPVPNSLDTHKRLLSELLDIGVRLNAPSDQKNPLNTSDYFTKKVVGETLAFLTAESHGVSKLPATLTLKLLKEDPHFRSKVKKMTGTVGFQMLLYGSNAFRNQRPGLIDKYSEEQNITVAESTKKIEELFEEFSPKKKEIPSSGKKDSKK